MVSKTNKVFEFCNTFHCHFLICFINIFFLLFYFLFWIFFFHFCIFFLCCVFSIMFAKTPVITHNQARIRKIYYKVYLSVLVCSGATAVWFPSAERLHSAHGIFDLKYTQRIYYIILWTYTHTHTYTRAGRRAYILFSQIKHFITYSTWKRVNRLMSCQWIVRERERAFLSIFFFVHQFFLSFFSPVIFQLLLLLYLFSDSYAVKFTV